MTKTRLRLVTPCNAREDCVLVARAANGNGTKKTLLALLIAIALSLSGWALLTTVGHGERLSRAEANVTTIVDWLGRVESKLDRVLERGMP